MTLQIILLSCISFSSYAQWQQCTGTTGLNMQALLTNGIYNFQAEFDPIISPNLQLYSASIYGSAYMNIQIIPEPSSVVLLILGIVFIKKL